MINMMIIIMPAMYVQYSEGIVGAGQSSGQVVVFSSVSQTPFPQTEPTAETHKLVLNVQSSLQDRLPEA